MQESVTQRMQAGENYKNNQTTYVKMQKKLLKQQGARMNLCENAQSAEKMEVVHISPFFHWQNKKVQQQHCM